MNKFKKLLIASLISFPIVSPMAFANDSNEEPNEIHHILEYIASQIAEIEDGFALHHIDIGNIRTQIDQLQKNSYSKNAEIQESIRNLSKRLKDIDGKYVELANKTNKLYEESKERDETSQFLYDKHQEVDERLKELESQNQNLSILCQRLEEQNSNLSKICQNLENQNNILFKELKTTQGQLETVKSMKRMETGNLDFADKEHHPLSSVMQEGTGKRMICKNVRFSSAFHAEPKVFLALSHIDTISHLRIRLFTKEVTNSGFIACVETWHDSKLWGTSITWTAFLDNIHAM